MYLSAPLLLPTRRLRLPNTIYVLGPKTRFHQQEHSRSIKHIQTSSSNIAWGPTESDADSELDVWQQLGSRGRNFKIRDSWPNIRSNGFSSGSTGLRAKCRSTSSSKDAALHTLQALSTRNVLKLLLQGRVTSYGFLDEVMLQILQVQWLNRLRNFAQQRLFTIISPRNSALQPNGHNRSQKCKFGQAILDVPRKVRLPTHQGPCILNIEGLFFDPASSTIAIVTVGV